MALGQLVSDSKYATPYSDEYNHDTHISKPTPINHSPLQILQTHFIHLTNPIRSKTYA